MENRCQKFTTEKYVNILLDSIDYSGKQIIGKIFLENSCGKGNILVEAVKRYIEASLSQNIGNEQIRLDLERLFYGYEVDENVAKKCKEKLDSLVVDFGLKNIKWNIFNDDYLLSNITVDFDYIVGNPPYIMYQELDLEERNHLRENYISCKHGKFDYCYAFIEKSIINLKNGGKMSYLVPNSIFKNVFADDLRNLMKPHLVKIIDYKQRRVFDDALTSSAIIIIEKNKKLTHLIYSDEDNDKSIEIDKQFLEGKWIFNEDYRNIHEFRNRNQVNFGDYFDIVNSVATLLNSAFVISNYAIIEKKGLIVFNNSNIEVSATRIAASPRSCSMEKEQRIIFPYYYDVDNNLHRYTDEEFCNIFPLAAAYLSEYLDDLNNRKADGKWFEYGRSQALSKINQEKLLISSVITDRVNVYSLNAEVVPYSGFFVVPKGQFDLNYAKNILESQEFYDYIQYTAINANGKSIRTSVKEIRKYPLNL